MSPTTTQDVVIGKILSGLFVGLPRGGGLAFIMFLLTGVQVRPQNLAAYGLFLVFGSISFSCASTILGTLFDRGPQKSCGRLPR